ncbi:MAG: tRNA (guanosine(46)-N7)-methyltransferase TrmB [Gammaproteobacteria bacterium]|nr:tRNA (guanosine(46)-N7)-methyltransferase TrmB [Gammaproteobacteria bacterium]
MHLRQIKSFALRQGRMTRAQKEAMDLLWPQFSIDSKTQNFADTLSLYSEIVLEIGFGMGDALLAMAQAEPHKLFIGIEVHGPGVGRLLHLIGEHQVQNIRVIQCDAMTVLQDFFPADSLNQVHLFFPDPWPKKRHFKRRIVQTEFANLIAQKLKLYGIFHLATDWKDYAQHMMKTLSNAPSFINLAGINQYADRTGRPLTKFENRGIQLGHEIFDLRFQKNSFTTPSKI